MSFCCCNTDFHFLQHQNENLFLDRIVNDIISSESIKFIGFCNRILKK